MAASRAVRIAVNASSLTPSLTWTLPARCAATVVSQAPPAEANGVRYLTIPVTLRGGAGIGL
jgi:hypothetical protein